MVCNNLHVGPRCIHMIRVHTSKDTIALTLNLWITCFSTCPRSGCVDDWPPMFLIVDLMLLGNGSLSTSWA